VVGALPHEVPGKRVLQGMGQMGVFTMNFRVFLAASAASLSLATVLATPVMAQETTSAIEGQVTGESGAAFGGAKVTVLHVPTGTTSTVVTDPAGNFSLRGLRVGGPYTVTVDGTGFAPETVDNIQLFVGDTLSLPVQLSVREILVSGQLTKTGRELSTGSQSTFSAADIANTVSARRDIRDVMRKDLLASYNANVGGVSIAGGNIRTQRFSVDGVQMQDSFGLNYGGLPSSRGIVSLEAIDQLTVKAAPFDISEGNFQGGAVNVVLKSGTNTIHGSVFGNWGSADTSGKLTRDNRDPTGGVIPVLATTVLPFRNYGASLSGPIIKDKLFLSLAYEYLTEGTPNPYGLIGSSAPNVVKNASATDTATVTGVNTAIAAFNANYGNFAIGGVPTALSEKDKKYSAKLDWNIMDGQRFSASYIHHENSLPNFGSGGSTSTTSPYIALQSDLYALTEFTNAFAAQLNSQWSDKFSTELRASYKYYRRGQEALAGPDYAQFNVCLDPTTPAGTVTAAANSNEWTCTTGNPILRMGPDTPRQANKFNSKLRTFQANASYRAGAHTFKLEYDNSYSKLYNLFVYGTAGGAGTGGPNGLYYFDSYADFAAKKANELILNSTTVGDKANGFVDWGYTIHTVGGQDTWKINRDLTIDAGVRYDFYRADKTINVSQNFLNRFSVVAPGLTNNATLNGRDKVQPRFGFNWATTPTLRLAGGVGLFAGGLSDVFVSNNYSNSGAAINGTGTAITGIDLARTSTGCIDRTTGLNPGAAVCAALDGVTGNSIPTAVTTYLQSNTAVLANATTNSLDPKFKLPAQWKYNLSVNWRPDTQFLGGGWSVRADALFSDTQQGIRWIDLRARPLVVGGITQVTPDGRPRYGGSFATATSSAFQPGSNSDIQMTNTDRGQARVFAVGIDKRFDWGTFGIGYTHQNVKDVSAALTSSTVGSSYGVPTYDANAGGAYGRSVFEVTNSYRASMELHKKVFGDNETRFGVTWNLRSGVPWSATMSDFYTSSCTSGRACVFGTVNTTSSLLYVPDFNQQVVTGVSYTDTTTATPTLKTNGIQVGTVIFADQATYDSLKKLVQSTALAKYQGQVAAKNALTGPWYSKLDLNFAQEIPVYGRSKVTAMISIENFLNLLNRNWGSYQEFSNTAVVRVSCAQAAAGSAQTCANYVYSTFNNPTTQTYSKASLWTLRAGVRFSF
jgi:hypothetical protein